MAVNAELSDLTAATSPTGGELIYIVQGGNSRKLALGAVGAKLLDDTGFTGALTSIGVTAQGRALLDDTGQTKMLVTLGGGAKGRAIFQDTGNTAVLTELGFSALAQSLRDDTGQTQMLTTLGSGAKGRAIFRDTGSTAVLTELGFSALARALIDDTGQTKMQATLGVNGIIQNVIADFGAVGDGATNDSTAFNAAKAAGGLVFIPEPATSYEFTTAIDSTNAVSAWLPDPSQTWAQLTDSGQLSLWRGRATGLASGANNWRLSDRVFVGAAASQWSGDSLSSPDGGTSWAKLSADAANYLPINGGLVFINGAIDTGSAARNQPYGITSAVKGSASGGSVIAFGSTVVNDVASAGGWGMIIEGQRESGASNLYGFEINVKNKGSNGVPTPVLLNTGGPAGTYALWCVGGGDAAFGGASTNPSTAALAVLANSNTWNAGIVMAEDALTDGAAIALSSTGTGGYHKIKWHDTTAVVFRIGSQATDGVQWDINRGNSGLVASAGSSNIALFATANTTGSVNYWNIANAASGTGVGPLLSPLGSDTNASARVRGKGTGGVQLQDGAGANKFAVDTTGVGFFAATPVARGALAAPSGTITRTTFATSTVTTAELAERVYAMINDLRAYGLFS